jgi:hypothetical protein
MTTNPHALASPQPADQEIADAVLPAFSWEDDKKRRYLVFRLCGFSRNESCDYAHVHPKSIQRWRRDDPDFDRIERTNLLELREQFSTKILKFEFTRQYLLAMQLDYTVLTKAHKEGLNKLSKAESDYLGKMRSTYGPQQIQTMENLFKDEGKDFDWEMIVRGKGKLPSAQTQEETKAFTVEA